LSHLRQAKLLDLPIIPVINKIDLPSAEVIETMLQVMDLLEVEDDDIYQISAKTGLGVEGLLQALLEKIPGPGRTVDAPLKALVYNSDYQRHVGVRAWVRIVQGELHKGDSVHLWRENLTLQANEIGYFELESRSCEVLKAGEVGYLHTGLKDPTQVQPGDTLLLRRDKNKLDDDFVLPGYKKPQPMVYLSLFPVEAEDYPLLTLALDKLKLVDSSLAYTPVSSPLLGHGYRVGFLGLLHAEIVQERLDREYDLTVLATTPSVPVQVYLTDGRHMMVESAANLPDPGTIDRIEEPILEATIFAPHDYLGTVMELMQEKRSELIEVEHVGHQVKMLFDFPMMELVGDFYGRLKSTTSGYASVDYIQKGYRAEKLVRLDILLAGDMIPVLAQIVPRDRAEAVGRVIVEKLSEIIPRHQFEVAVQAAIGGKIIARATVKAFRKDVTAKLYGVDQTRKDKLLKKQKKGKKKMKQIGKVNLPPDTFMKLLSK